MNWAEPAMLSEPYNNAVMHGATVTHTGQGSGVRLQPCGRAPARDVGKRRGQPRDLRR